MPNDSLYLESYFSIPYSNIYFTKSKNSLYYGSLQLTIMYKLNDDKIVGFEKVNLLTEEVKDTSNRINSLLEIFRKSLPAGSYKVEFELTDNNDPAKHVYNWTNEIELKKLNGNAVFSDVQLLDRYEKTIKTNRFTKGEIDMIPYSVNFYPNTQPLLRFYCELYHSKASSDFLVQYTICDPYTKLPVNNLGGRQRCQANEIVPVLGEINLNSLPTGNYVLNIEAIDKNKTKIASQSMVIFRVNDSLPDPALSNNITQRDFTELMTNKEVYHTLNACRSIATDVESDQILMLLKQEDTTKYKPFLFNFFLRRNAISPVKEYTEFVIKLNKLDELFGCHRNKGYATDRGRMYLKYGPPDFFIQRTNSGICFPYEIWTYNNIGNQLSCKIVFLDPEVSGCDFRLLHTTIRGYATDPNWKEQLSPLRIEAASEIIDKSDAGISNYKDEKYKDLNLFMEDYNR
jgi:GWxTD domain-containing protein